MAIFKRRQDSKDYTPAAERDEALAMITRAFPSDPKHNVAAQIRHRVWFRNVLYYMGEQWLVYIRGTGGFGRMFGEDMTIPTPVSDFISDTVNSLCALTLNKQFATRVWPNSTELADEQASKLAQGLLQHLDARNDGEAEDIQEMIELNRIITGNGFARVGLENSDGYLFDARGELIDKGEVTVDCVLPFGVMVPDTGLLMRHKAWWATETLKTREWVEDVFKVVLPKGSERDKGTIDLQKQLIRTVAEVSGWKGADLPLSELDRHDDDLVMFREMEIRPTAKHSRGRTLAVAEGKVLADVDELMMPMDEDVGERGGRGWDYSLVHFPMRRQVGSFWSKDAVSPLISPQNIVNEIDQALAINRQTFGRPWVLTPAGLTLRRLSARASKILALEFDASTTHGVAPQVVQGVAYPNQVLSEREQQRAVAQDAAGDPKNVLSGQAPSGSASGIMVDILRETAEQSHVPDIKRFYRGWNKVNRLRLKLAQKAYNETRQLKIKGKGGRIAVKSFTGSDLRSNTDVRFELDSGAASTNAGRNAFLIRLIEANFWGDISTQPQLRSELLRRFGLSGFAETDNVHIERARTENAILVEGDEKLLRGVALPPPLQLDEAGQPKVDEKGELMLMPWPNTHDEVFALDPHEVHLMVHEQTIFGGEFRDLEPEQKARLLAHRMMHYEALAIEVQQDVESQIITSGMGGAGGGQGAPGQSPGGNGAPTGPTGNPAATGAAPGGTPPPAGGAPPIPGSTGAGGGMSPGGGGAMGG